MKPSGLKSRLAVSHNQYCLLGLPFDAVSLSDAAEIITQSIDQKTPCFLSTPNLNFTVMAQDDAAFYDSVIQSDLVVVDGMPLIWVAKLLDIPIKQRVAGSDLFAYLSDKPRVKKIRVFFFGGESGIAENAHHELNRTSSGMESCGFYDPGFVSIEEMSNNDVITHINTCAPVIVVGYMHRLLATWALSLILSQAMCNVRLINGSVLALSGYGELNKNRNYINAILEMVYDS